MKSFNLVSEPLTEGSILIKNWKIDHITMAVDDNKVATEKFIDIFGANFLKEMALVSLGAQASYVNVGETVFGLESPTKENSDIGKFLKKRGKASIIFVSQWIIFKR